MRLIADENVDLALVAWLRELGHDVLWVAEASPAASDPAVLSAGYLAGRVLVTFDLDFGELVYRRGDPAAGVLLLRLRTSNSQELLAAFSEVWREIEPRIEGKFVVATNKRIRVRDMLGKKRP